MKIDLSNETLTFQSPRCHQECMDHKVIIHNNQKPIPLLSITAIGATAYRRILKNPNRYGRVQAFALSLYDINRALEHKEPDLKKLVPEEFHEFLPLFEEARARRLPPHRNCDHSIQFKDDSFKPPFGPLYSMSRPELLVLKEWLENNLDKGFI